MTVRALPLAIGTMALLAAAKTASLIGCVGWSAAPEAHASDTPASPARPPAEHASAPRDKAAPTSEANADNAGCSQDAKAEPSISAAERAALQDLRARREQLDAREKSVAMKESVLAAAQKQVEDRVKELGGLQSRLEAMEQARKKREEADWQGLVRTYEAMRPRDAAAIMAGMETNVLLEVLDRMNDRKAALVLAAMPPDRARLVTADLAAMRLKTSQPASADQ